METESKLLEILFEKPYSQDILSMATELERNSKFNLKRDIKKLRGIWELRWSSSNNRFLSYSPFIDNLQFLNPSELNAINLLKPKGLKRIIGTGIIAKLNPLNDIRVGVKFTHAGFIGPKVGFANLNALAKIKREQTGWLDITYLSNCLRICRGDKGTLFVLTKRIDEKLFTRFQEFINKFY